jgi:hypothetical protein
MEIEEVESLYIIQLRESIRLCEDVYKVGKTKVICRREKQYPKGSKVIMVIEVEDCNIAEKKMIKYFKDKFKQRRDLGTEYFEGNINEMIEYYKSICIRDITNDFYKEKAKKVRNKSENIYYQKMDEYKNKKKDEIIKIISNEVGCGELDETKVKDYIILKILLNDEDEENYNMILSQKECKKIVLIKDMMLRMDIKITDININMINKYDNEVNNEYYVDNQEIVSYLFRLGSVNSKKYKDYYFLLIKMIRNVCNLIDDIKKKYINKKDRVCYYVLKNDFQEYLKIQ